MKSEIDLSHPLTDKAKRFWLIPTADTLHRGETEPGLVTTFGDGITPEIHESEDDYYAALRPHAVAFAGGLELVQGQLVTHGGTLYEVIQGHTSQVDWTPGIVPALFNTLHEPLQGDEYPPWVQPQGAHDAYAMGARVTWNGKDWESSIDANVWEPGVHGWKEI